MSDAVNDQHLAAMGLADTPLGQPYATTEAGPSRNNEGRCTATLLDFRCAREEGHDGVHARGKMAWDPDVEIEVAPGPTKQREGDQVLPTGDESLVDDQALLIADIEERRQVGIQRYGQGHRPFNGRNTIQDFYEEMIDGAVYGRSLLRLREATREDLLCSIMAAFEADGGVEPEDVADLASIAADRVLDYVTVQTAEAPWALHLVDAYYQNEEIDFQGERVPAAIQARIAEWEARRG